MAHPLLGEKIDYNVLNPKQQESYNLQKVSAIFAEYGYLVIKLSDDWNGADFIALKFGSEDYLKIQLKGRFGFYKKYINKNINICFFDNVSNKCYLYPHDDLLKIFKEKIENTESWNKENGEYHFPALSVENANKLKKYIIESGVLVTDEVKQEVEIETEESAGNDDLPDNFHKNNSNGKDKTQYSFNGVKYGKGKLVLAVVKEYIREHNNLSFSELKKVFPKELQGSYFVVETLNNAKEIMRKSKKKRHFIDSPIELSDGEKVVVTTEWGISNIGRFIARAMELGFNIRICK